MPPIPRLVDPRELRFPPTRQYVDPIKLHRQVARYGADATGMPPLEVYEGSDGVLVIYNGVTRATRIAKYSPGTLVPVIIVGRLQRAYASEPTIGDRLP